MNRTPPQLPLQPALQAPVFPSLSFRQVMDLLTKKCAPFDDERVTKPAKHHIVLLPEAYNQLKTYTCFGKKRAQNAWEQVFQGIGHIFVSENSENKEITVVISNFFYLYADSRGPTSARMVNPASNQPSDFLDRLEKERNILVQLEAQYNRDEAGYQINPCLAYGASSVVCYGHTHPNLGAWFSEPDHRSNKATQWVPSCILCVDPIRKKFAGYAGRRGDIGADADITILHPNKDTRKKPVKEEYLEHPCELLKSHQFELMAREIPTPGNESEALLTRLHEVSAALLQVPGVKGQFHAKRTLFGKLRVKLLLNK